MLYGPTVYDRRDLFTLSDGGQIYLDYMGEFKTNDSRPLLFVVPGLYGNSQSIYIRNIAKIGKQRGYDVVVINYRGLCGAKLTSPRLYCSYSYEDIQEPIVSLHEKYPEKKIFAVACSMGANILTNMIGIQGENCLIQSACIL